MKVVVVAKKCKLLDMTHNTSGEGQNTIDWTSVLFGQDGNYNTVTIDKKLVDKIKVGQIYDFVIQVSENPKPLRNGSGAFIENKFKIIDIDSPTKSV